MPARTVSRRPLPTEGDELRRAWDALAEESGSPYFRTWAWVTAWSEILEPEAEITIVVTEMDGRVDGILPLAHLTRRLHSRAPLPLRYLGVAGSGSGAADHLGPVALRDDAREVLWREASLLDRTRPLLFENTSGDEADLARAFIPVVPIERVVTPAVDLGRGPADSLWKSTQRRNVRNRDRRLEQAGVKHRWYLPSDAQRRRLGVLRTLHRARWGMKGGTGALDERRLSFLRRLSELSRGVEGPRLLLLEHGDVAIGALLGFRYGNTFHEYMTGWDPEWARLGPGSAAVAEAMRHSQADGAGAYDFLRGSEAHKYQFGARDVHDVTLMTRWGPRGALLRGRELIARRRSDPTSGRMPP